MSKDKLVEQIADDIDASAAEALAWGGGKDNNGAYQQEIYIAITQIYGVFSSLSARLRSRTLKGDDS